MQKNKKILIVSECFFPEEFKINDVAFSWIRKGYSVDVLTLNPTYPFGKIYSGYKNKFFYKEKFQGVNIYRVRAISGYRDSFFKKILRFLNFMFLGSIAAIFIGRKYDYIFGFNTGALTSMLPAVVASKIYNKPLMFWVQDVWPDSLYAFGLRKNKMISYLLNGFVRFMHKDISSVAISGKGFEESLRPHVKNNLKFHYLPNWTDALDIDLPPATLSEDHVIHFTFAGNIGKQQNLKNIINAFCLIPKKYNGQSQLNIIGDGSNLDNLKNLSINNPRVVFHGKKKREEMSSYFKASNFLIVSLVDEPIFSLTVPAKTQTYIAAKKPILAIINGDTANLVKEYSLGLHAHPSDIAAITDLFQECIKMNEEQRAAFTSKNDFLLDNTFNKEKIINQLLEVLITHSKNFK